MASLPAPPGGLFCSFLSFFLLDGTLRGLARGPQLLKEAVPLIAGPGVVQAAVVVLALHRRRRRRDDRALVVRHLVNVIVTAPSVLHNHVAAAAVLLRMNVSFPLWVRISRDHATDVWPDLQGWEKAEKNK